MVTPTSVSTVVGQEAHVIARELNGPRGQSPLTTDERDAYDNLILLCATHHTIIDADPAGWPVAELKTMRTDHEQWVREQLGGPANPDPDDLHYGEILDGWAGLADLDGWEAWTSHLLAGRPTIYNDDLTRLADLNQWLFRRPWPETRPDLEAALRNFRRVVDDVLIVLPRATEPWGDDQRAIDVFYKTGWHEQAVYEDLTDQFEWIVDLIHDLTFELSRAANLVLREVRSGLDPLYRREEGDLVVQRMHGVFELAGYRPAYPGDLPQPDAPYEGLEGFVLCRTARNESIGAGMNAAAYRRITPLRVD